MQEKSRGMATTQLPPGNMQGLGGVEAQLQTAELQEIHGEGIHIPRG